MINIRYDVQDMFHLGHYTFYCEQSYWRNDTEKIQIIGKKRKKKKTEEKKRKKKKTKQIDYTDRPTQNSNHYKKQQQKHYIVNDFI